MSSVAHESEFGAQAATRAPRGLVLATWALIGIGLLVAAYMTFEHFTQNKTLACNPSGIVDCASVTTSAYSSVLGIPVAVLGLGWFLATTAVAAWAHSRLGAPQRGKVLTAWYGVGLLFVLYLVYVELVQLGKICSWCTVVHVDTLLLFLVGLADLVLFSEARPASRR